MELIGALKELFPDFRRRRTFIVDCRDLPDPEEEWQHSATPKAQKRNPKDLGHMGTHPSLMPYIVSSGQLLKKMEFVERWLSTQEPEYVAVVFLDDKGKYRSEVCKFLVYKALQAVGSTTDIMTLSGAYCEKVGPNCPGCYASHEVESTVAVIDIVKKVFGVVPSEEEAQGDKEDDGDESGGEQSSASRP